jgi:hypothetical protein
MKIHGSTLHLNDGGAGPSVTAPAAMPQTSYPDVTKTTDAGWQSEDGQFKSIVTRAPTHEPFKGRE